MLFFLFIDCFTDNDEICIFPFTYNEKSYHTCTKFGYDQFWCSTDVNKTNRNYIQDKWGVCKKTCPTGKIYILKIGVYTIMYEIGRYSLCTNYSNYFQMLLHFLRLHLNIALTIRVDSHTLYFSFC